MHRVNQTTITAPVKTVERLIIYRILLEKILQKDVHFIFSRQIAEMSDTTATQVRRDLMSIGYTGSPQKGYDVRGLLGSIRQLLEPANGITLALVGVGNLGRSILGYFTPLAPRFQMLAAFDADDNKVGRLISGCPSHHVAKMKEVLSARPVQLGIITTPDGQAQETANQLVEAGVHGIVNFAPSPLRVPPGVHCENMHITMTFEKAAFFSRLNRPGGN